MLNNIWNYLLKSKEWIIQNTEPIEIIETTEKIVSNTMEISEKIDSINNLQLHLGLTLTVLTLCGILWFNLPQVTLKEKIIENKKSVDNFKKNWLKYKNLNIMIISNALKLNIYQNIIKERSKNIDIMYRSIISKWNENIKLKDWLKDNISKFRSNVKTGTNRDNIIFLFIAHLIIINSFNIKDIEEIIYALNDFGRLYLRDILIKFHYNNTELNKIFDELTENYINRTIKILKKNTFITENMEFGDRIIINKYSDQSITEFLNNIDNNTNISINSENNINSGSSTPRVNTNQLTNEIRENRILTDLIINTN